MSGVESDFGADLFRASDIGGNMTNNNPQDGDTNNTPIQSEENLEVQNQGNIMDENTNDVSKDAPESNQETGSNDTPEQDNNANAGEVEGEKSDSISDDEDFQSILDALNDDSEEQEKVIDNVQEELGDMADKAKTSEERNAMLELQKQLAESTTKEMKSDAALKVLKQKYDELVNENAELKYGNRSDEKVMEAVNDNARLSEIMAQEIAFSSNPEGDKSKLVNAYKRGLAELGVDVDAAAAKTTEQAKQSLDGGATTGSVFAGSFDSDGLL